MGKGWMDSKGIAAHKEFLLIPSIFKPRNTYYHRHGLPPFYPFKNKKGALFPIIHTRARAGTQRQHRIPASPPRPQPPPPVSHAAVPAAPARPGAPPRRRHLPCPERATDAGRRLPWRKRLPGPAERKGQEEGGERRLLYFPQQGEVLRPMHLVSLQLRFRRKCAAAELRWKVGGVSSPAARASVLSGPRRSLDRSWAFETLPSPAGFLPELGWVATCTWEILAVAQRRVPEVRVIVCECVNIQCKRLEQLSGANPQTQPGVSDFIWQLAASEDSSRTTGEAGRSPALAHRLSARLSWSLSDTAGLPASRRPDRAGPASIPPQLASLISFLVYHRYVSVQIWGCGCGEGWRISVSCSLGALHFFGQTPHIGFTCFPQLSV